MKTGFITDGKAKMTYYRWGNGPRILLALHGYGETGLHFRYLAEVMSAGWSIVAPDLPFHGETEWDASRPFTAQELARLLHAILEEEKLTLPAVLMGYSMGGRIALHLYQQFPTLFNAIALIAPDGLRENFWYWLATQTTTGNRLFRYTMRYPGWFRTLAMAGVKLEMVNPSANKFIQRYMHDPDIRNELYTRWTGMRHFRIRLKELKEQLRNRRTPVLLMYGVHDRIITSIGGEQLRKGLEENVALRFLPAGHQLLQPTFVKEVAYEVEALWNRAADKHGSL